MKIKFTLILSFFTLMLNAQWTVEELSQELLYAIRTENSREADSLCNLLANSSWPALMGVLVSDQQKTAFWLNIYNAYIQKLLIQNKGEYQNRRRFFKKKQIEIAGNRLSFDFIEHGILRRSKAKLSLGYCNKLFATSLEKNLRVKSPDYRIHFALNCGASSCPPIAFYDSKHIQKQLEMAETAFIQAQSRVDSTNKVVYTSELLSWFRGDFGGKKGIKKILIKHRIIPDKNYKLKFDKYNWMLELNKYSQ